MTPTPCYNPSACKQRCLSRTEASLPRGIADATAAFPEILCKHLRICLAGMHGCPALSRTQMNTARGGGLRQRRQLWLDRLPRYAEYCGQAQERRLAHARVSARESGSTMREQSTRRRAATRNVQLAGATNARPFQQPAFLPTLHSEPAASCVVRSPNADRIRP